MRHRPLIRFDPIDQIVLTHRYRDGTLQVRVPICALSNGWVHGSLAWTKRAAVGSRKPSLFNWGVRWLDGWPQPQDIKLTTLTGYPSGLTSREACTMRRRLFWMLFRGNADPHFRQLLVVGLIERYAQQRLATVKNVARQRQLERRIASYAAALRHMAPASCLERLAACWRREWEATQLLRIIDPASWATSATVERWADRLARSRSPWELVRYACRHDLREFVCEARWSLHPWIVSYSELQP